jgi:hypothetical protein
MYGLNYTPTTLGVQEQKRLNTTGLDTMQSTVFWVVMKISSERARRFGVAYRLRLQGWRVRQATNQQM